MEGGRDKGREGGERKREREKIFIFKLLIYYYLKLNNFYYFFKYFLKLKFINI